MPEALPFIPAAISGISALSGLFGGGNQPPPAPPPSYQPQQLGLADSSAIQGIQGLGQTIGGATNAAGSIANNPFAPGYQANAGQISPFAMGAGMNLVNAGQSYLPYAQQTLQTGFDPQNALYAQQFQLQTDQDRAAQAARGLGTSPYGAGIENQANQLFNLNWQNAQLGRQAQAASTAQTLTGAAGGATTTGLNTALQGAALPYTTANTIGQNSLGAFGTLGGIQNPQIADYLQYLGIGNQSAGVANQAYANQITGQNNAFNQQQTLGKNLGSSISGLGTYFGNGTVPGAVGPTSLNGAPLR